MKVTRKKVKQENLESKIIHGKLPKKKKGRKEKF